MEKIYSILFDCIVLLEFSAALVGTIFYKKYLNTKLRYFFIYLWLIFITELVGTYLLKVGLSNVGLYTSSKIIQYNFILLLFNQHVHHKSIKRLTIAFTFIFNAIMIVNIIGINGISTQQPTYAFSLGSVLISVSILLFFYEISKTDAIMGLKHSLIIWLGSGLLMFHMVVLPLTALANVIPKISGGSNSLLLFKFAMNIVMYTTFIIGYIWSKGKSNF